MMSVKIAILPKWLPSVLALLTMSCGGGTDAGVGGSGGGGSSNPTTLQFSTSQYSVTESTNSIQIAVDRTGDTSTASSIDYTITPAAVNPATQGADYIATNGTLNFAPGESVQSFSITILNDINLEFEEEYIQLNLLNPAGAQLGANVSANLTIIDDDNPGQLQFTDAVVSINEGSVSATITVNRSGGVNGPASIEFATANGSATAGQDYTASTGTLTWADGEPGNKLITVNITDDIFDEGVENFTINLTNAAPMGIEGGLIISTVNIIENDISATSSLEFIQDTGFINEEEYAQQLSIPAGFGIGDFTLQLWVRPDLAGGIGPNPVTQWTGVDTPPNPNDDTNWWWDGNFLLDGHNNNTYRNGTFSLQFYGGGRVRWLFGDGSPNLLAVQAYPATNAASLLDGQWHQITLVRRCTGNAATLELWVDGGLIDSTASTNCTNMRNYWDDWTGYPSFERGWFWGVEKLSVFNIEKWEDYKGLFDELRFWSRALSTIEIESVRLIEPGLVGNYRFNEGSGNMSCDEFSNTQNIQCMDLYDGLQNSWNTENAPLQ